LSSVKNCSSNCSTKWLEALVKSHAARRGKAGRGNVSKFMRMKTEIILITTGNGGMWGQH